MYPHGFSRWNREKKIEYISKRYLKNNLSSYQGKVEFSENVIGSIDLPFSVVPGLLVNDKEYCLPLVTEESSVVAALARSVKNYAFYGQILSSTKVGHIHLIFEHDFKILESLLEKGLPEAIQIRAQRMISRGGGIKEIKAIKRFDIEANYYQIQISFDTCAAMGANFINTILEEYARYLSEHLDITIVMSIVSNYTPQSLVNIYFDLRSDDELLKKRLVFGLKLAKLDVFRAVTNNKGICNGIDALLVATGNDFRAVEAGIHAYAARNGSYQGLTDYELFDDRLRISLTIPVNVGVVGGSIGAHPMSKLGFDLLQNPSIDEFRLIVAAVGLAQNFAALRALLTEGIQKGHMRLHMNNILKTAN
jgi:hydroxymethylglutaryl-CoA reductase